SCTNTSNPYVLVAAGLVAKKAAERGLETKPWVKTSLAPGSKAVTDYLIQAEISKTIDKQELVVASVLSGNRNIEVRVHPEVRANYLASPPLVVAYALAGRIDIDMDKEPLGVGKDGKPVFLKDIWPTQQEVRDTVKSCVKAEAFQRIYADVFTGDAHWQQLQVPTGDRFAWDNKSTYVKNPP